MERVQYSEKRIDISRLLLQVVSIKNTYRKICPDARVLFGDLKDILKELLKVKAQDKDKLDVVKELQNKMQLTLYQLGCQLAICPSELRADLKKHVIDLTEKLTQQALWDGYARVRKILPTSQDSKGETRKTWSDINRIFISEAQQHIYKMQRTKHIELSPPVAVAETQRGSLCMFSRQAPATESIGLATDQVTRTGNYRVISQKHQAILQLKADIEQGREQGNLVKRQGIFSWLYSCFVSCMRALPQGLKCIYDMIVNYLGSIEKDGGYNVDKHEHNTKELWQGVSKVAKGKIPSFHNCFSYFYNTHIIGRNSCVQECYKKISDMSKLFLLSV